MSAFAIINTKSGKFLYGTDYRYNPPHQRTSKDVAQMWHDKEFAEAQLLSRHCSTNYRVVEVEVTVIEETEDVSTQNGIFKCKACGCTVEEDGVDYGMVNYCPDCGKWVSR